MDFKKVFIIKDLIIVFLQDLYLSYQNNKFLFHLFKNTHLSKTFNYFTTITRCYLTRLIARYDSIISILFIDMEDELMPRGDKTAYTAKQKRQAKHIVESEVDRGHSQEEAERIAWSTVNKQDGGGKKKSH